MVGITGVPSDKLQLRMMPVMIKNGWQVLNKDPLRLQSYDLEEVWLVKYLQ